MSYLRTIIKKASVLVGARRTINFIEGTNITLTIADDSVNDEVDVTINASGGGGSGLTFPQVFQISTLRL